MADQMLRIAGRGTDGKAKPFRTDNDGAQEIYQKTKTVNAIPLKLLVKNTWEYSSFINASEFSGVNAIVKSASGNIPIEVYVEFSSDGTTVEMADTLFTTITNGAGNMRLDANGTVKTHLPYVRFRIRHQNAADTSVSLKVRLLPSPPETKEAVFYKDYVDSSIQRVEGYGGGQKVLGMLVQEPFSGSANISKTFSKRMNGFFITNDGETDLTFTIASMTFTLKAGESFRECFAPFTVAAITTTSQFRAWGLY